MVGFIDFVSFNCLTTSDIHTYMYMYLYIIMLYMYVTMEMLALPNMKNIRWSSYPVLDVHEPGMEEAAISMAGEFMMYYIESEMPMILKTQAHDLPVCVCVYTALLDWLW